MGLTLSASHFRAERFSDICVEMVCHIVEMRDSIELWQRLVSCNDIHWNEG